MKNDSQIIARPPSNIQHKVFEQGLTRSIGEEDTMIEWAMRYMNFEVVGVKSIHTVQAKKRDLAQFFQWYQNTNGHLKIETWLPRDTQGFLQSLEKDSKAPSTVNRAFATLRRFARWVHDQADTPFQLGLPTKGVKERATEEPDAQKLNSQTVHNLLKAADALVLTETRKNSRPRRNRAIFSLLLHTGLRPSELTELKRDQYDGQYLNRVKRKGNSYQDIYVRKAAQEAINDYLEKERLIDDPSNEREGLILPNGSRDFLERTTVNLVVDHIAQEASKHRKDSDKIKVYPYQLRHTFAAIYRQKAGSDVETAKVLGHAGIKYVGRYGKKTKVEHEADLEGLEF